MVSGTISLPCTGCFSPFPHGTGSLSVSHEYLALADGPAGFTLDYSCPALLRVPLGFGPLPVPGFHRLRPPFPERSGHCPSCRIVALQPQRGRNPAGLGSSPVARHYWGNHSYFLFLQVLRCFSSLRSPPTMRRIPALQAGGLSHSEIRGSRDICSYPRLIAAYHVLHRLHEPRHPPCALIHFLGSGHQHGRSYFQLYPDKQKCQENFFVEFYSTVSCVNMSKISWCQPGSKRRVRD